MFVGRLGHVKSTRERWFSPRALLLHVTMVVWVSGCAAAAYWQVGRATQGNALSFLYAVEWPVFAVLGVLGWWALLHMEQVTEHQMKARQEYEEKMRREAQTARQIDGEDDPTLAAYNDHLNALSTKPKKKLWGH